ncbi:hypothetical protein [Thiosulfativibrio zosterae]|nr:hypothetical protein [Thiosulfativibrio zosterae]
MKAVQNFVALLFLSVLGNSVCMAEAPNRSDFLNYEDSPPENAFKFQLPKPSLVPLENRKTLDGSEVLPVQEVIRYENRCVHAKGTASTEGVSEAFARQMAIRDALKNASMQNNVKVSATQEMENFRLTKASERFTTQSKVQQYQITREGMMELNFENQYDQYGEEIKDAEKKASTTYEVELDVCLTEDPAACNQTPGNQYQLKLAVAQVAMDPNQGQSVSDISNLLRGYQLELDRRLTLQGYQNKEMIETGSNVYPNLGLTPNLSPDVLDPIRDRTGAQYLLVSIIRSASRHNDDSNTWNNIKRFYNQEIKPNARYIELDWYLIDLMNHRVQAQDRLGFDVKGNVTVGREKPFGTNAFFDTDTGMVFHALLEQQTQGVMQSLHCLALETQIIDKRDGDIIIFLSADSGAQVGDTLAVYHKFGNAIRFQGVDLGVDSEPSGFLKIKRIQNKFAVATIESQQGQGLIDVGDLVKAW